MPEVKSLPDTESNLGETVAFVLRVLRSRKLLILGLAALLAVLTAAALPLVPKKYKSEAMVLVVKQAVPERYVTPTSTTGIGDEVQAMAEEVMSRTQLMGIIDDLHLFAKERQTLAPEEIVEKMRKRIDIKPLMTSDLAPNRKDFSAFKISFSAADPQTAQDVTSRLTSLFIQENLKNRQDQATNTAGFLSSQLETVKQKLDEQEARLRDYKMQHIGELPDQQQGQHGYPWSLTGAAAKHGFGGGAQRAAESLYGITPEQLPGLCRPRGSHDDRRWHSRPYPSRTSQGGVEAPPNGKSTVIGYL